ncbi:MAG: M20 family metallopeptidase [Verrucomicrobia bacterium]|nr:M20 family metallopeptidase [Verrucomicrobiota bacterium]MCH8510054.1 M20 family metallopeptidase [Kiritimatiellia bacterium]
MNTQRLTDLLTDLIRVPSVNPAHNPLPEHACERRMADALTPLLQARGFSVERLELYGPDRPALIASAGADDAPRSFMFEIHLDTVGVGHMTIPPFEGNLSGGRLYGRGACDMKGSTAALLHALTPERVRAITDRGIKLLFVGAPDEECGTKGATTLAQRGLRADQAMILEPTRCVPVVAHKGANWYDVVLKGRSGHGSQPESGVSTNEALARLLPEILRAHKSLQQMHAHPLLGQSTLNIGQVRGGVTYNIIPDHTVVQLDRRVIPTEKPELFEQAVRHILDEMVREKRIVSGECIRNQTNPAFFTPPESELPQTLLNAIEAVTGLRPKCEGTSWMSDAAPLSQVCGQTVVFGPGDIAQAHTADEYIEVEDLVRGAEILARFLDQIGT